MLSAIITTAVMYCLIAWAYAALHKTPVFRAAVSPSASKKEKRDAYLRLHLQAAGVAIAAGLLVYLTGNVENPTWALALPCYGFAAAGFVGLFLWGRYADERREVIPFIFLTLAMEFAAGGAAATLGSLISVPVIGPVVMTSHLLAGTAFLGYMLSTALFSSAKKSGKSSHKVLGIIVIALCAIALIAQLIFGVAIGSFVNSVRAGDVDMAGLTTSMSAQGTTGNTGNTENWFSQFVAAIFGGNKANQPEVADAEPAEAANTETSDTEPAEPSDVYMDEIGLTASRDDGYGQEIQPEWTWNFRHIAVMQDETKDNDFDFGLDPLEVILKRKLNNNELSFSDLANKSERQLFALVTVGELLSEMVDEMAADPALGAAVMAWWDVNMGTRHTGEFFRKYEEEPDQWAKIINSAKAEWCANKDAYYKSLSAFVSALEHADVKLTYAASGLDDQMYQYGFTTDLVPDVVVLESADLSGWLLTVTNNIKGRAVTFSYRVTCGFQPTNVGEVMNVTPAKNPNKPSTPSKPSGGGGGSSAGGGSTGTGAGGAANTDGKGAGGAAATDPGKAAGGAANPDTTKRQDNPLTSTWSPKTLDRGYQEYHISDGPDEFTGSGVGGQYSTKEVDLTGSTFMDTYEEYKEYVKENLVEPNNGGTRTAKDPNTPTYTPAKEMPIDSNADKGNGGAPINTPTPVSPGATYTVPSDGGVNTGTTDGNKPAGTTVRVTDEPRGTDWGGLPDA
ncbi:hypothetical protein IKG68_01820 [Candidatus Saccharibacteria bacterium]|nr:hypothetical protein [Candidatus Saccharibacteria bacterium]